PRAPRAVPRLRPRRRSPHGLSRCGSHRRAHRRTRGIRSHHHRIARGGHALRRHAGGWAHRRHHAALPATGYRDAERRRHRCIARRRAARERRAPDGARVRELRPPRPRLARRRRASAASLRGGTPMSDASILFVDHTAMMGGAQHSLLDIAEANRRRSAVALFEDGPFATALEARGMAVLPLSGGSALRQVKKNSIVPGVGPLIATMRLARTLARTAQPFDLLYANSPKSFVVAALAG